MPLTIYPFDTCEIEEIYGLLENVYSTSGTMCELFNEKFPDPESCCHYFLETLIQPGSVVLFARVNGFMAGYITLKQRTQRRLRHISDLNMGVHSEFRGQGIGKLLLSRALEQLMSVGIIEIVYLVTRDDNIAAKRLYKNFGFEKIAHLTDDTKIGDKYFDAIMMRKLILNRKS